MELIKMQKSYSIWGVKNLLFVPFAVVFYSRIISHDQTRVHRFDFTLARKPLVWQVNCCVCCACAVRLCVFIARSAFHLTPHSEKKRTAKERCSQVKFSKLLFLASFAFHQINLCKSCFANVISLAFESME